MREGQPKRGRGRPATGTDPLVALRLPEAVVAEIDALAEDGETRSDVIRVAIAREIKRRKRRV